jgi:hypothetical protein
MLLTQTSLARTVPQDPVVRLGSGLPLVNDLQENRPLESLWDFAGGAATYQIGDDWGKLPVGPDDFASEPLLLRAAQATASLGGGTTFYLGTFNGEAVIATNHHVCDSLSACKGKAARFPLLKKEAKVTRSLGTWKEIDLSLLVVTVSEGDREILDSVAANFDFESDIVPGQELFTAGFGVAMNPLRKLVANQDQDCKVFSKENDFRLMEDPDSINPGGYKTWSFANGCDVSHGDSGSAMVDRHTGQPIGIIWTGKIPKNSSVQNSARLAELVGSDDSVIWTELSYAVPGIKIKEYLSFQLGAGEVLPDAVSTLKALLEEP